MKQGRVFVCYFLDTPKDAQGLEREKKEIYMFSEEHEFERASEQPLIVGKYGNRTICDF